MDLLVKPQYHRIFPSLYREKVTFESNRPNITIPPLYVYIDNYHQWNIDTFWLLQSIRQRVNGAFSKLYLQHVQAVLGGTITVAKILEAADHGVANQLQHAVLMNGPKHPRIRLRYYDLTTTCTIPGRRLAVTRIHTEEIFDDIARNIPDHP